MTPAETLMDIEQRLNGLLIQREPYPVAAPATPEETASVVRVARESSLKILCFGSGSSFSEDLSLFRENIIAVTTTKMNGVSSPEPNVTSVGAGVIIEKLFSSTIAAAARTIGGLIAGNRDGGTRDALCKIWQTVTQIEVVDGLGDIRRFPGPANPSRSNSVSADLFIGSAGKSGIITQLELMTSLPMLLGDEDIKTDLIPLRIAGSPVKRDRLSSTLDPDEIFRW